jgi:hypothetical protein
MGGGGGVEIGALYVKTQIRFIVSGDVDSPEERFYTTVSVCILSVTCWPTVHNALLRSH